MEDRRLAQEEVLANTLFETAAQLEQRMEELDEKHKSLDKRQAEIYNMGPDTADDAEAEEQEVLSVQDQYLNLMSMKTRLLLPDIPSREPPTRSSVKIRKSPMTRMVWVILQSASSRRRHLNHRSAPV